MLKELLYPLVDRISFFNIFQYITFRAAYAAVTALILSFLFGPWLISFLTRLKAKQQVRADGPRSHFPKTGTPVMGGILIIVSVVVSVIMWQDIRSHYTWIGVIGLLAFGLIGFLDDFLKISTKSSDGLKARVKFCGQVIISLAIVAYLYGSQHDHTTYLYLPFFKYPILDLQVAYIPFAVILMVGTSNAVNLTDGLDGLASGLVILVGITFALLSYLTGRADYAEYLRIPYIEGSGELTVLCLALVGACVGFLWYNSHPAEVFMGDTGSLALGGLIGIIALIIKKEVHLIIVGGVFVIEALSVIIQVISFKLSGKRVLKMAPLHHHFELLGWAESKVVVRFWILGALFSILSLSTLKIQ
ncbi:MAG: phospho-N-acetylmuramoyl-pentapeptide-transferase [Spirochaetales bacterium]|nr:phospho-N-acetylmuramoyl-pentapeptide-transferase [Spirochaetales bacterium]